jgi:serine/threonine-protein kinase HipA
MHLKNFSMFLSETGWVLSPFYDLLNVKMILPEDKEDMALLLGGKKENFNKGYFDRLAVLLNLNDKQINSVYKRLIKWQPEADQWIERSFLETERQIAYKKLIAGRIKIFHP